MGGGKGIEETSRSLQKKVTAMNEPLRSEERETSHRSILDVCRGVSGCIQAFENSLYEKKHAYYFRRAREWHDYNEVR